ncbi:MAG: alpha/beta hydrolase [Verrucomicrobia bacterium]|nr:alpha/beta hydrolase [Verrucomicrobiota bacterium]
MNPLAVFPVSMRVMVCSLAMAAGVAGAAETTKAVRPPETTPLTLPGAETHVFRELKPDALRLHVFKPKDWKAGDRRPALVWFFGGGWTRGTPANATGFAKWAADLGCVGVAPDYRVKDRFGTSPLESVADARAAVRWVQDHAAELGVDPQRVVVGGNSAGGHVALWTAIAHKPPGSAEGEAPKFRPAALLLTSAVSDTSKPKGYTPGRFGDNAEALSPLHQLDAKMPPMLVFHGDADTTVPQAQSLALRDKLLATGNTVEFISVPGGSHNFGGDLPEWKEKTRTLMAEFLMKEKLLPVAAR